MGLRVYPADGREDEMIKYAEQFDAKTYFELVWTLEKSFEAGPLNLQEEEVKLAKSHLKAYEQRVEREFCMVFVGRQDSLTDAFEALPFGRRAKVIYAEVVDISIHNESEVVPMPGFCSECRTQNLSDCEELVSCGLIRLSEDRRKVILVKF
jgi:hypothetical protein